MKKTIILLSLVVLCVGSLPAQQGLKGVPGETPPRITVFQMSQSL